MMQRTTLIFDAGGVLVFPDFELLNFFAEQAGIQTTAAEIAEQHARLFFAFDEHCANNHKPPPIQYFFDLFKRLTNSKEKARTAYNLTCQADKETHIWKISYPWVSETLRELQEFGFQMAVVSNSDGRVDQILQGLGLRDYFQLVIDSFVVGVEKPDRRIFEIALHDLGWDPGATIYIGDIFYVDVFGANQTGLGAIHLDQKGFYKDWPGIHIPSLRELPNLLTKKNTNNHQLDLYPLRDFKFNE